MIFKRSFLVIFKLPLSTNGMFLKNKEEVKRFCEILSSKPKNESRLEKVDYEVISGRELLNLLKNNK